MARHRERGFSLLELMVSLAILLVISSAAFLALNQNQKVFVTNSTSGTMYATVRSAAELIAQEIGQAGTLCGIASTSSGPACVNAYLSGVSSATSITISSNQSFYLYPGEKLTIDPNSINREVVQISTVSCYLCTTAAVGLQTALKKTHSSGTPPSAAPVTAQGVIWNGVVVPSVDPNTFLRYPTASPTEIVSNKLGLLGDINGDGTLMYVEYTCDFNSSQLTRSISTVSVTSASFTKSTQNDVLVDNLQFIAPSAYTNSFKYCFSFPLPTSVDVTNPNDSSVKTYPITPQVSLLISVQSPNVDPQTGHQLKFTKSFLNLSPRNSVAALDDGSNNVWETLQELPPSVTSPWSLP